MDNWRIASSIVPLAVVLRAWNEVNLEHSAEPDGSLSPGPSVTTDDAAVFAAGLSYRTFLQPPLSCGIGIGIGVVLTAIAVDVVVAAATFDDVVVGVV